MQHPFCKNCFESIWQGDRDAYARWLDEQHNKESFQIPKWVIHCKCVTTQGAGFVNMGLIFFMGAATVQSWLEKHEWYSPNIGVLVALVVIGSFILGEFLFRIGLLGGEQAWYVENNKAFDTLRKDKDAK